MSATTFGRHESVAQYGRRLGAVVEVRAGEWRPVCTGCYRRLTARGSRLEARAALRDHWDATHRKAAA